MTTRILIDLLGFTGARGGTETYAREVIPRLPAHLPGARFAAVTGRRGAEQVRSFFPGRLHVVPWVGEDPATWAVGAVAATELVARRHHADLVWAPANFGPIFRGLPRVVTVHDAIYDEVPGNRLQRAQRRAASLLMARSARTADRVLTVSKAAADSIRERLDVPRARITVIHNGSSTPAPVADPWAALGQLDLPPGRPIALSVGNRMPHKNLPGLLRSLASLPAEARPFLVLAGSRTPDPIAETVDRLGLTSDVLLPGWVTGAQLEALYQISSLYICPSLAEGFGLPVVDALRRRVPVLAHDIPVLREVGVDATRFADARKPEEFGTAIRAALADPPSSAERDRGAALAALFDWETAARDTAAALDETFRQATRG